jgi:hypothetical protein
VPYLRPQVDSIVEPDRDVEEYAIPIDFKTGAFLVLHKIANEPSKNFNRRLQTIQDGLWFFAAVLLGRSGLGSYGLERFSLKLKSLF